MIRRIAAVFVLGSLAFGASPRPECGGAPLGTAVAVVPAGAHIPGGCGQAMSSVQCQSGLCAVLPHSVPMLATSPRAPTVIEFPALLHGHTPLPPEPPPPQS